MKASNYDAKVGMDPVVQTQPNHPDSGEDGYKKQKEFDGDLQSKTMSVQIHSLSPACK